MLKNYFFIALRNIFKYKIYSLINIVGLAVGITCTILILLYVTDEISFDKFHSKADRIYRVIEYIDPAERSSSLPFPTSEAMLTDFPNYIENSVRFFNFQTSTLTIEYAPENGQRLLFNEPHIFFADSTFFKVFDFKLLQGNPNEVLNKPDLVLVTKSTAQKYFGNDDPVGKRIRFEGQTELTVAGVLEDTPSNSHFKFDFIISFATLDQFGFTGNNGGFNWYWNPCWTYITLKEGVNPKTLQDQFPDFVQKYFHPAIKDLTRLELQPLTDIHLYSNLDYEIAANSDVTLVYIFGIIAVFILAIAGINFINLSTARSMKRAREVGVRKVMGALPQQLIGQFLAESVLFSLIAILLAIPFVYLFLPGLNALAAKQISFTFITSGVFWAALFSIVVLVGLVGGIYPALFLSSFQPVKVLAGKVGKLGSGAMLRKLLVVAQFAISGILIIGTIITYNQLNHLRSANLGFDKDQVLLLPIQRTPIGGQQYYQFVDRMKNSENIIQVSAGNMVMGTETQTASYIIEGKDKEIMMSTYFVEPDFGKTLGMEFIAGRDFSTEFASDTASGIGGVIINESFLKLAGWNTDNALGKRVTGTLEGEMRVIGVVKDFHYTSLRQPVAPFLFVINPNSQARQFFRSFAYIRIKGNNYKNAIANIESIFKDYVPNRPFEYSFLDEKINSQYKGEDSLGKIATVFSLMAIFVACLGLFGLSSFTAEQRTKEIGIRKVVGASVGTIVMLLSKQFLILVAVANLIAWPSAFYLMNLWLSNFQTRTSIDLLPFITAAVFTFVIAFATMSFQAIKAAQANPVKSLKYE
ncbi:MAG: ABC transporter permease [Bacteroidetes bacterium]|nr:ABC transporter permease [Bacteroidota bacterium]